MGNHFGDTVWFSCHVVSAQQVVCPKDKCGEQGLHDYSWHHLAATAAIPELFGAAKHFDTKNRDGELSYKYKDIQSKYMGNLDKLELFRKDMKAFDMFDPFLIPLWIELDAISVLSRWQDRKKDALDLTNPCLSELTKHWLKVLLNHTCAWKMDTFHWCTDDNNLTSMEWVKEFLTKSCDISIVKHADQKFDELIEY
jgi:hypothetical protein